jgi:electron transfer flavoprotein alpha subunit
LRIATLVKQVPEAESLELLGSGRLRREGVALEMNAYCRRAVRKGVDLARELGGECVAFTLGPPAAEDSLREALAGGADSAVHVCDPAFAGSDTLATARALAAALSREGPFDLVLVGRNSVDADTGQVGPELAELLGLPFVAAVRELRVEASGDGYQAEARSELDDGWRAVRLQLPAVLSTAERLCEPVKMPPADRAAVSPERINRVSAAQLGTGPWGEDGSPTSVGRVRHLEVARQRLVLSGPVEAQVARAVELLAERGLTGTGGGQARTPAAAAVRAGRVDAAGARRQAGTGELVAVLVEPGRPRLARELLGEAARLASQIGGEVAALAPHLDDPAELASWGADLVCELRGASLEEDVAAAVVGWSRSAAPWAVLAPGTLYGREVAARAAARLGAGLTGDAVELEVEAGRLTCWKPAFGGSLVAAITASSPVQMATVRPGVLACLSPRQAGEPPPVEVLECSAAETITVVEQRRDDDVETLLAATRVLAVGAAVPPEDYSTIDLLAKVLGAELAATRKVTDKGWLPHARQVGLTGHSVAPELYVAVGVQGKFNHVIGTRGAGTVLAVNVDPAAPVFEHADIGLVGDFRDVVPALTEALGGEAVSGEP